MMATIRLHNTATRVKEDFTPIDASNVRMYVCGPTVYDRAHLGNARPVVVFDVLFRLLRHVYGAEHVTYVRNFTDLDDKINATAQARKAAGDPRSLEALIRERTEETISWYHADMDALGALRPSLEPRATDFIGQMVTMIEGLIRSGHAYEKEGHVLFRVRSYKAYGALSGRSVDDMIAGARVEVAPFKEDPMDFVLWKPSDADLPGWDSPWGRGRPGWHIECSAMADELLGASFDIHGGGLDLQFPHHENEIAQSRCAHPEAGFAKVWLHNEMVLVGGEKMSKSLGNFLTVRDLLRLRLGHDDFVSGTVRGANLHSRSSLNSKPMNHHAIRLALLMTHYRDTLDWNFERALEADRTYSRIRSSLIDANVDYGSYRKAVPDKLIELLSDDLNTPGAVKFISELASNVRKNIADPAELVASMEFLGLIDDAHVKRMSVRRAISSFVNAMEQLESMGISAVSVMDDLYVSTGVDYRTRLYRITNRIDLNGHLPTGHMGHRTETDFAHSSVTSRDREAVSKSISESELVDMIRRRIAAKENRNFNLADEIRVKLSAFGVELIDQPDGVRWRMKK
jgi:cysteinyl-tRNA synthetase